MLEYDKVKYLISLPKKVKMNNIVQEIIHMDQNVPFHVSYMLVSEQEVGYIFLYDIKQGKKNHFKLSLYLMDNDTRLGLVRIDYSGQHNSNPVEINEYVPVEFELYAGKFFKYGEPHIHYYIEGYKPMAWAIPLSCIDFRIQQIKSHADVISAFNAFNELISLNTKFMINTVL
jgi:hypothetical protein